MRPRKCTLTRGRIAVVIPCYHVERHIASVIQTIPPTASLIVIVDDCSPDDIAGRVQEVNDSRVVLVRHTRNQGVGGAMLTGYKECLKRGTDIVVKMDGDGQMDPGRIPDLVKPLLCGKADYTKGNRWQDPANLADMPPVRRLGNLVLSFLTKAASGYWTIFDPNNGYTAIRTSVLKKLPLDRIARDYFFETSMLVELNILGAVTQDIPMPAIYGNERSSLRIRRVLCQFPWLLVRALARRVWNQHFIRNFGPVALFLTGGAALSCWGTLFGVYAWLGSLLRNQPATAGTVMLAAMPFLMGFQLLLQALVMDIHTQPAQSLSAEEPIATESDTWSAEQSRQAA